MNKITKSICFYILLIMLFTIAVQADETATVPLPVLGSSPDGGDETFGVPIPVVGTTPNGGSVLGVLLAVVSETDGHIDSILAPVAIYNDLTGYNLDINYFGFPTEYITYQLYLSQSTKNFWEHTIKYQQKEFIYENVIFNARVSFFRAASERFYGIGAETEINSESTYTEKKVEGYLTCTTKIVENFSIALGIKGRHNWLKDGVIKDVDDLQDKFPDITGIDGSYTLALESSVIYDTRDDDVSPTSGIFAQASIEIADEAALSSFSFRRYSAQGTLYLPLDKDKRFVTVIRGKLEYLEGKDIPFFELSSLGGQESLRGYGRGRFYDKHSILINLEQRIRAFRFFAGDILLDIEAAIFADIGQVFPSFSDLSAQDMKVVGGIGIRFVVRSQIVAKVDIGYGDEGSAVFAGLDYPF